MYEKATSNKIEVSSFPSSSSFSSQPLKFFFYWRPSYLMQSCNLQLRFMLVLFHEKSVVIALILFLVFCGILLYWV